MPVDEAAAVAVVGAACAAAGLVVGCCAARPGAPAQDQAKTTIPESLSWVDPASFVASIPPNHQDILTLTDFLSKPLGSRDLGLLRNLSFWQDQGDLETVPSATEGVEDLERILASCSNLWDTMGREKANRLATLQNFTKLSQALSAGNEIEPAKQKCRDVMDIACRNVAGAIGSHGSAGDETHLARMSSSTNCAEQLLQAIHSDPFQSLIDNAGRILANPWTLDDKIVEAKQLRSAGAEVVQRYETFLSNLQDARTAVAAELKEKERRKNDLEAILREAQCNFFCTHKDLKTVSAQVLGWREKLGRYNAKVVESEGTYRSLKALMEQVNTLTNKKIISGDDQSEVEREEQHAILAAFKQHLQKLEQVAEGLGMVQCLLGHGERFWQQWREECDAGHRALQENPQQVGNGQQAQVLQEMQEQYHQGWAALTRAQEGYESQHSQLTNVVGKLGELATMFQYRHEEGTVALDSFFRHPRYPEQREMVGDQYTLAVRAPAAQEYLELQQHNADLEDEVVKLGEDVRTTQNENHALRKERDRVSREKRDIEDDLNQQVEESRQKDDEISRLQAALAKAQAGHEGSSTSTGSTTPRA